MWLGISDKLLPGYANGGYHSGGARIVGEQGPELEVTGSSFITDAKLTKSLLKSPKNNEETKQLIAELGNIVASSKQDAEQVKQILISLTTHTAESKRILQRWDGDGQPEVRVVA